MTPLLEVRGLSKSFPLRTGFFGRELGSVKAVDGISFEIERAQTLALVGESGCGKTTAARALLRLIEPTAGAVLYRPDPAADPVDLFTLPPVAMRALRRDLQIVFQDPYASLNPRMSVGEIVGEALRAHRIASGAAAERRVCEALERVGLRAETRSRFPHEFSGGERQRIGIARALVLAPKFVVCDEAVSALDVSIQAQVINLLRDLQSELGLAYLFIAHDLALVRYLAHRVAVMYLGRIVEIGTAREVFESPAHPYTQALLAAIPASDPRKRKARAPLSGEVPSALEPPSGCPFRTRCPWAEPRCAEAVPALRAAGSPAHTAACHLIPERV